MNPQAALDAPRWRWDGGRGSPSSRTPIRPSSMGCARAATTSIGRTDAAFGRGQIIWKLPGGGYVAGSDKRADGCAAAY